MIVPNLSSVQQRQHIITALSHQGPPPSVPSLLCYMKNEVLNNSVLSAAHIVDLPKTA